MSTIEAIRVPATATRSIPWRRLLKITAVAIACLGELFGAAAVIYGVNLALSGSQAMTTIELCSGGGALLMVIILVVPAFATIVKSRRLCYGCIDSRWIAPRPLTAFNRLAVKLTNPTQ